MKVIITHVLITALNNGRIEFAVRYLFGKTYEPRNFKVSLKPDNQEAWHLVDRITLYQRDGADGARLEFTLRKLREYAGLSV